MIKSDDVCSFCIAWKCKLCHRDLWKVGNFKFVHGRATNLTARYQFPTDTVKLTFQLDLFCSSAPVSAQSGIQIIDPQQIRFERLRKVEETMTSSELVSEARLMGFEDDEIERAMEK